MASIYDKALKRKDYSGVIDKDKQRAMADKKKEVSEGAQKGVPSMSFWSSLLES